MHPESAFLPFAIWFFVFAESDAPRTISVTITPWFLVHEENHNTTNSSSLTIGVLIQIQQQVLTTDRSHHRTNTSVLIPPTAPTEPWESKLFVNGRR